MKKFVTRILQLGARRRLLQHPGVRIHPTSKVNFRGIQYHVDTFVEIHEGSIVEGTLVPERAGASIRIGRNTFIGASLITSAEKVQIGDDVLIAWGCVISDHDSHAIGWSKRSQDVKDWYHGRKDWSPVQIKPIKIGDKAWLGMHVIVLKGVQIGEGAVIAAGSVVVKDVPAWTVVAGNPARIIREIPIEER